MRFPFLEKPLDAWRRDVLDQVLTLLSIRSRIIPTTISVMSTRRRVRDIERGNGTFF